MSSEVLSGKELTIQSRNGSTATFDETKQCSTMVQSDIFACTDESTRGSQTAPTIPRSKDDITAQKEINFCLEPQSAAARAAWKISHQSKGSGGNGVHPSKKKTVLRNMKNSSSLESKNLTVQEAYDAGNDQNEEKEQQKKSPVRSDDKFELARISRLLNKESPGAIIGFQSNMLRAANQNSKSRDTNAARNKADDGENREFEQNEVFQQLKSPLRSDDKFELARIRRRNKESPGGIIGFQSNMQNLESRDTNAARNKSDDGENRQFEQNGVFQQLKSPVRATDKFELARIRRRDKKPPGPIIGLPSNAKIADAESGVTEVREPRAEDVYDPAVVLPVHGIEHTANGNLESRRMEAREAIGFRSNMSAAQNQNSESSDTNAARNKDDGENRHLEENQVFQQMKSPVRATDKFELARICRRNEEPPEANIGFPSNAHVSNADSESSVTEVREPRAEDIYDPAVVLPVYGIEHAVSGNSELRRTEVREAIGFQNNMSHAANQNSESSDTNATRNIEDDGEDRQFEQNQVFQPVRATDKFELPRIRRRNEEPPEAKIGFPSNAHESKADSEVSVTEVREPRTEDVCDRAVVLPVHGNEHAANGNSEVRRMEVREAIENAENDDDEMASLQPGAYAIYPGGEAEHLGRVSKRSIQPYHVSPVNEPVNLYRRNEGKITDGDHAIMNAPSLKSVKDYPEEIFEEIDLEEQSPSTSVNDDATVLSEMDKPKEKNAWITTDVKVCAGVMLVALVLFLSSLLVILYHV